MNNCNNTGKHIDEAKECIKKGESAETVITKHSNYLKSSHLVNDIVNVMFYGSHETAY
jgi:hypothetical protein